MGFSFHITTINEGAEFRVHLQNQLGTSYCMFGEGEVETIEEGLNYYNWYRTDTTNNDQMVEIMEKLYHQRLRLNATYTNGEISHYEMSTWGGEPVGSGKTINEAVCNAAYEYFKAIKSEGWRCGALRQTRR